MLSRLTPAYPFACHVLAVPKAPTQELTTTTRAAPNTILATSPPPISSAGSRGPLDNECETANNDVDSLLRMVSVVEGGATNAMNQTSNLARNSRKPRFGAPKTHCGFETRSDNSSDKELAAPKRRCGTVYLGGAEAPRGYAASSISQR